MYKFWAVLFLFRFQTDTLLILNKLQMCHDSCFSGVLTYHIKHPPSALTAASPDQPILLTKVNCGGEETNLGQCGFDLFSNSDALTCHHNEDVVLSCIAPGRSGPQVIIRSFYWQAVLGRANIHAIFESCKW